MINFKESKNIYLYSENIDMRFGLNKAQIIVASSFSKIEIRHSVFVFCSRDCRMIKIYYEDDYGAWLLQNKMFKKKFKWPNGLEIGQKISKQQLEGLCKGLEVIESRIIRENKQIDYY